MRRALTVEGIYLPAAPSFPSPFPPLLVSSTQMQPGCFCEDDRRGLSLNSSKGTRSSTSAIHGSHTGSPKSWWFAPHLGQAQQTRLPPGPQAGWEGSTGLKQQALRGAGWPLSETQLHFHAPSGHELCCRLPGGRGSLLLINLLREQNCH